MIQMEEIRNRLLRVAAAADYPPELFVLALAETLATVAAQQDVDVHQVLRVPLSDRLDTFVAHVRARHPDIMQQIVQLRLERARNQGAA